MKNSAERRLGSLLIAGICCALVACSEDESGEVKSQQKQPSVAVPRIVALVGEASLSEDELRNYVTSRSSDHRGPLTEDALGRLLEEMLTAEVLYQEALRRKLDQAPAVRRALRQILGQKLLEQEVSRPVLERTISEEELQAYFAQHRLEYAWPEQIRLADIFIGVAKGATDDEKASRAQLAERVLADAIEREGDRFSFSELVREYSDKHPRFAVGDTGFFDREGEPIGLANALAEAGFSLARNGQLHPAVIETPEGFHVIMRVGQKAAQQREYRDVQSELVQRIRRAELQQQRSAYLHRLREQADVRIETGNVARLVAAMRETNTQREAQAAESASNESRSSTPSLPRGNQ